MNKQLLNARKLTLMEETRWNIPWHWWFSTKELLISKFWVLRNLTETVSSFSAQICVKVYIYHSYIIAYCFPDQNQKKEKKILFFLTEKTCIYGNVACSNWTGKFTTIKYEILYFCLIKKLGHAIYNFKIIPIKSPTSLFCRRRSILQFIWTLQEPPNSQHNLEKEEQIWKFRISWFQNSLQIYSNQNSVAPV